MKRLTAILQNIFPFLRPAVLVKGYIEDEKGWAKQGAESIVAIPSTHDLGYCIDYAIRKNLEALAKGISKTYKEIGYKIIEHQHEGKEFITHLIRYQTYVR